MRKQLLLILFTCGIFAVQWNSQSHAQSQSRYMISEPVYTKGDSNKVYSIGAGIKQFQISYDLINWEKSKNRVENSWVFAKCLDHQPLKNGWKYYYRVIHFPDDTSKITFSKQDATSPEIETITIDTWTFPKDQWLNKSTFDICFVVSDSMDSASVKVRGVGVDQVWCYWRFKGDGWPDHPNQILDFYNGSNGKRGRSRVDSCFSFPDTSNDAFFEFFFQAKDAAYTPESPGINENSWVVDGNVSMAPDKPMVSFGIDRQIPGSFVISDSLKPYYNTTRLKVHYHADDPKKNDRESGLASVCLFYKYKQQAESDSFVQDSCHFFNGDTAQIDSFFLFEASHGDGIYETYTIAKDIAGNEQDILTSPVCSTFVDTKNPEVEIDCVKDTSSSTNWQDSTTVADTTWTNSSIIYVCIDTTNDPLKDGYASGVDSLIFALDPSLTDSMIKVKYEAGKKEYLYDTRFPEQGTYKIFVAAQDFAGNVTDSLNRPFHIINYDTSHPNLKNIILRDRTTKETTSTDELTLEVYVKATDNFKLSQIWLSEDAEVNEKDSTAVWSDNIINGDSCIIDYTFKDRLYQSNDTLWLYCMVIDSAGNISKKIMDDILYVKDPWVHIDRLLDRKADIIDVCDDSIRIFAKPHWTNESCVTIHLSRSTTEITEIIFSETSDFLNPDSQAYPPGDTTTYCFMDTSNITKLLYCIGINVSSGDTTLKDSATIQLDLSPPILDTIILLDTTSTPVDMAEVGWTNDQTVSINIKGKDTHPWENNDLFVAARGDIATPLDTVFRRQLNAFVNLNAPMDTNRICSLIADSAGNYDMMDTTINYDSTPPVLSYFDIITESKQDTTGKPTVNLEFVADDPGRIGLLKWIQLAEDSTFTKNDTLIALANSDTLWYKLTSGSGIKTVFCRVRDVAGNWSETKKDSVYLLKRPGFRSIVLSDTTLHDTTSVAFPGFTNDIEVTVYLDSVRNDPEFVYIKWEWDARNITKHYTYTDSIFQIELPDTMNTTYHAKCWLTNDAGSSKIKSTSITYDSVFPHLNSITTTPFACDSLYEISWKCDTVPPESMYGILINQINLKTEEENAAFKTFLQLPNPVDDTLRVIEKNDSTKVKICVKLRDFAGNWSAEQKCDTTTYDPVPARVLTISPIDEECIHFGRSNPDIITIQFSESTAPDSNYWKNSIDIYNNYFSATVVIDSTVPDTGFTSTLNIFVSINAPSQYELTISDFQDMAENPGVDTTASFLVYMEKDLGGTAERWLDAFNFIRFDVPPNSLTEDAVFILESQPKPSVIPGMEGFEAMATTCWYISAKNCSTGTLVGDLLNGAQITIGFDPSGLSGSLSDELRIIYKKPGSENWQLKSEPCNTKSSVFSENNQVSFTPLTRLSGEFCIVKQTETGIVSNYPNPFAAGKEITTIRFSLKKNEVESNFKLKIFDLFGNLVTTLSCEVKEGLNEVEWDGRNSRNEVVANGGYLCVIKKGRVRKIAVLK